MEFINQDVAIWWRCWLHHELKVQSLEECGKHLTDFNFFQKVTIFLRELSKYHDTLFIGS